VVKPGLITLGQRSGAALFPAAFAARWCLRVGSWDRMEVPLPLSVVRGWVGEPLRVPERLDEAGAEALRKRIEADLEARFLALRRGLSPSS
jgi:lysophospholipid acyltransferase (LPLAT)-like uncharacterized protein